MLPEFPLVQRITGEKSRGFIKELAGEKFPPFREVGVHVQFEGTGGVIHRDDGSSAAIVMRSVGMESVIPRTTPIAEFRWEHVQVLLTAMADQLARGQSELMHEAVSQATNETGNIVDGGGKPLTSDLLLKALEKMAHSFDNEGRWNAPTVVLHPSAYEALQASMGEAEQNSFNKKLNEILIRKREEYLAREAGRVLAG